MKFVNSSLISLKCVLFLFFGAIGSLFPFLTHHMTSLGLSRDESIIVSVVAPIIALLGPLVGAPLADRLAGGFGGAQRSKTGRYLRVMIAVCLVLATCIYWLLSAIPPIIRSPPNVSFTCDEEGAYILQDRCGTEKTCYNWGADKGSVLVKNCIFSCNASSSYSVEMTTIHPDYYSSEDELDDKGSVKNCTFPCNATIHPDEGEFKGREEDYGSSGDGDAIVESDARFPTSTATSASTSDTSEFLPQPHICHNNASGVVCEVYTNYATVLDFKIGLNPSITDNSTEDVCKYPFAAEDGFKCRINPVVKRNMIKEGYDDCNPVVLCEIFDPYESANSLLKISQCGYDNISFWLYLFVRSIGDIFTAAAVTLLATAVVIATRETSTGRGDIGKQFAAGALGFAIFAPIIGGPGDGIFFNAMICFTVLMLIAAVILLVDNKMPLSPPEWWWHTRCGLLALPMSSVRDYGLEIGALGIVLFLLGVFWNAIDTFLPWHIVRQSNEEHLIVGFTITVGALPAVIYLIFAERFVDYCGHCNILICCFINYIFHHLVLSFVEDVRFLLLCEWIEVITLHVMYVTAVLYLRHLVPRKLTACGQALPVIAHFCLGRCFGALFGGMAYTEYPDNFNYVHRVFTIVAAVVAIIYFVLYHFYLKPKYAAPLHLPPDPAPAVIQSMNGNGSYTPLRVYHNSKSKKGHFRY